MMSDNAEETWDFENNIRKLFDPDDVSAWLSYSPIEFMSVMLLEIRQQKVAITKYAELLDASAQLNTIRVGPNEPTIPANFCTQLILREARLIDRLLDTIQAYRAKISEVTPKE